MRLRQVDDEEKTVYWNLGLADIASATKCFWATFRLTWCRHLAMVILGGIDISIADDGVLLEKIFRVVPTQQQALLSVK